MRKELLTNEFYWSEKIKDELYNEISDYIQETGHFRTNIAEKLGVTKGRISNILNGRNLNLRLDTLVRLSIAIGKVPVVKFVDINSFPISEPITKGHKFEYTDEIKSNYSEAKIIPLNSNKNFSKGA